MNGKGMIQMYLVCLYMDRTQWCTMQSSFAKSVEASSLLPLVSGTNVIHITKDAEQQNNLKVELLLSGMDCERLKRALVYYDIKALVVCLDTVDCCAFKGAAK